jgi:hypothetical protein
MFKVEEEEYGVDGRLQRPSIIKEREPMTVEQTTAIFLLLIAVIGAGFMIAVAFKEYIQDTPSSQSPITK